MAATSSHIHFVGPISRVAPFTRTVAVRLNSSLAHSLRCDIDNIVLIPDDKETSHSAARESHLTILITKHAFLQSITIYDFYYYPLIIVAATSSHTYFVVPISRVPFFTRTVAAVSGPQ
jgi:hypothetical protein